MSVLVDSLMLRQIPGKSSRFQGCRTVIRGLRLSPCVAARCAARLRFCRLQRLQHTDTLGGGPVGVKPENTKNKVKKEQTMQRNLIELLLLILISFFGQSPPFFLTPEILLTTPLR